MPEQPDFGTFGRYIETPADQMSPEMRDAYEFTKKLRGIVPGPHRIWLANPKLSKTVVPTGAYFQRSSTLKKAEIEIVTNVINGRWLAAYSNYEHEWIAEEMGDLPPEKVEAIIAGLPTFFDNPRQQVVYELASTLAQPEGGRDWIIFSPARTSRSSSVRYDLGEPDRSRNSVLTAE